MHGLVDLSKPSGRFCPSTDDDAIMTAPQTQEGHVAVQVSNWQYWFKHYGFLCRHRLTGELKEGKRLGLYRLAKRGRNIRIYNDTNHVEDSLLQVDVGGTLRKTKTIGFLMPTTGQGPNSKTFDFAVHTKDPSVRGPTLLAMSGWSGSQKVHPQLINSKKWAWVAWGFVAACIGHEFNKNRNDNAAGPVSPEFYGRERASHVEVQLSTAYAFGLTESFIPRIEGRSRDDHSREQFRNLFRIRYLVPEERRDVAIYLDHEPCHSCRSYVYKLERLTGLRIRLVGSSVIGPREKETEPIYNVEEIQQQIEEIISKSPCSMEDYGRWTNVTKKRKRHTNATKKRKRHTKDYDSDSSATMRNDSGWDSDVTLRADSDVKINANTPTRRTSRHLPYRNPFPQPVYESPTAPSYQRRKPRPYAFTYYRERA